MSVCVRERESVCVRVREREREVKEREGVSDSVCVGGGDKINQIMVLTWPDFFFVFGNFTASYDIIIVII